MDMIPGLHVQRIAMNLQQANFRASQRLKDRLGDILRAPAISARLWQVLLMRAETNQGHYEGHIVISDQ